MRLKQLLLNKGSAKKISLKALLFFIITLSLCCLLISITVVNRMNVERLTMEQIILEKSIKANEVISRFLYKTQTLSSYIQQHHGEIVDFEWMASTIVDDPAIVNVLLAPGGKVSNVYPLQGNEAVIGLDFFAEGAGNKEAVEAVESARLVFGGPFDLVQGGRALVGRLPVYINNADGERVFWGIVSVTLRYPQALDAVGFNELQAQGFAYEIWRINPDDGEKQIISDSGYKYDSNTRYIEKHIEILNADWFFRILPVRAWYAYPETWVLVFLGVCISTLVAMVTHNNSQLTALKSQFESMAQTDSLTGVFNRRHFIDLATSHCERSARLDKETYVVIFDIDHFKKINDKYGHHVGDKVLIDIALRVKGNIRPYDIFARYGGEEFILLICDIVHEDASHLLERLREFINTPTIVDDVSVSVTASFGASLIDHSEKLDTAIKRADDALYAAKRQGRNRVVFSG